MNTPPSPSSLYKQQIASCSESQSPSTNTPIYYTDTMGSNRKQKLYHPYRHSKPSSPSHNGSVHPIGPSASLVPNVHQESQPLEVPAGYTLVLVPENQYGNATPPEYNGIQVAPSHQFSMYPSIYRMPLVHQRQSFGLYDTMGQRSGGGRSFNGHKKGPQRPPNAFILYRSDKHRELLRENPKQSACSISQTISRMWANETPEVKGYYQGLAAERKAEFEANRQFPLPSHSLFRIDTPVQPRMYTPTGSYNTSTIATTFQPFSQEGLQAENPGENAHPMPHQYYAPNLPSPSSNVAAGQPMGSFQQGDVQAHAVSATAYNDMISNGLSGISSMASSDNNSVSFGAKAGLRVSTSYSYSQPAPSSIHPESTSNSSPSTASVITPVNLNPQQMPGNITSASSSQSWSQSCNNAGFIPLFANIATTTAPNSNVISEPSYTNGGSTSTSPNSRSINGIPNENFSSSFPIS